MNDIFLAAQEQFSRDFPALTFQFCSFVTREPSRWVVRVFYRKTKNALPPSIPMLYEVAMDGSSANKLDESLTEAYAHLPQIRT